METRSLTGEPRRSWTPLSRGAGRQLLSRAANLFHSGTGGPPDGFGPPAGGDGRAETRLLGLRRSALVEMVLFLAAALVIDHFFFDGRRYIDLSLHPFWLLVILISAQYGTGEGLCAAGLSSFCLLAGNVPEQSLSQDAYDYIFSLCRLPLSWSVIALVLGEIRTRHMRERDRLRLSLAETADREANLSRAYAGLNSVKDKLEARVAGQLTTAITMYQAARDLEKLEPAGVLHGMVDIVRAVLRPEKFSIYLLHENQLEVAVHEGWTERDNFARVFGSGSPLFRAAIGGQRFLCCANREDEVVLAQEGVLAGPLICTETGEISGLLKIERLGFLNLNFSNVRTFKVLCEWIASAYANARRFELARSESVLNARTHLLSYGFFKQHTAHLTELARRLGFDLSMLVVRLENESELPPERRSLIPGMMADAVKTVLRKTDLVFEHQRSGYEYAIVLPNTPVGNAQIVADKITSYLGVHSGERASSGKFSISVHSIHREDPGARIASGEIIPRQIEFFTHLAERVGFELFMIEIRPARADDLSPEIRGAVHSAVSRLLEAVLRPGEAIASSRSATCVFQLLFFGASGESARQSTAALSRTLSTRFAEERIPVEMSFTVQALHLQERREFQYERR
jgi:polysaccharide biosynthesis protein PelD